MLRFLLSISVLALFIGIVGVLIEERNILTVAMELVLLGVVVLVARREWRRRAGCCRIGSDEEAEREYEVGLLRWVIAAPLLLVAIVSVVLSAFLTLLDGVTGGFDGGEVPSMSVRRICRHAWRIWGLVIVGSMLLGVVALCLSLTSPDSPTAAAFFAIGSAMAVTAIYGARWLDHVDARVQE